MEYLGQNVAGKRMMTDLSGDEMKILGSPTIHTGMRLALQRSANDPALLIQIPCASIRWTRDQGFATEFGPMGPAMTAQLRDLLSTLQSAPTT